MVRTFPKALWTASLGFFLFAVVMLALWLLTEGKTTPPLPSMGLELLFWSMMAVAVGCFLSAVCGLCCVRVYPGVLFWLVPAALLLVTISVVAWHVFH